MSVIDGTIYAPAQPATSYTFPRQYARGSYRYLTLSVNGDATIQITGVTTHFTSAPHTADKALQQYTGYFHSDDDLLNRVWYAGVYTVQMCHVRANESRADVGTITSYGWYNNATINGVPIDSEVYTDGAKRDRTAWPGDFAVSLLPKAVGLNYDNLLAARRGIESIYALQLNGFFPYAGSPIGERVNLAGFLLSDTYHIWAMIAVADYTEYSGDTTLLTSTWKQTVLGMTASLNKVDPSDMLLDGTGFLDWGRDGIIGKNIELNALLYRALIQLSDLARRYNLPNASYDGSSWSTIAEAVKAGVNKHLWVESEGRYRDNTTITDFYPQDGNVFAVKFNLTTSAAQAARISQRITTNWNAYGSVSPEAKGTISPFITSSEIEAHLLAQPGDASRAMEILRRQWGYMLHTFSNSTLIEGYYQTGLHDYPFYGDGQAGYLNHGHAWSTGPVSSLSLRIGGLSIVREGGKVWKFQPHAAGSGVTSLQTGFTLAAGFFSVDWKASTKSTTIFQASFVVPVGTTGSIWAPTFGVASKSLEISINGEVVWRKNKAVGSTCGSAKVEEGYVAFAGVEAKRRVVRYTVTVKKA